MCLIAGPCKVIYQEGYIYDFKERFEEDKYRLLRLFRGVKDGRKKRGQRHELPLILLVLFGGITLGYSTIKDCCIWARKEEKFIHKKLYLKHGIPDETTVSRGIRSCDVESLIRAFRTWFEIMFGMNMDEVASFDGKSMRGLGSEEKIRHIVSLFTHQSKRILGQVAVKEKENEIPAGIRLIRGSNLSGLTIIGDAIHTQKKTTEEIRLNKGEYLLYVKKNQRDLYDEIRLYFEKEGAYEVSSGKEEKSNRNIETRVEATQDSGLMKYMELNGWGSVKVAGRIRRKGWRKRKGQKADVDETVYFISSNDRFSAEDIRKHLRNHWSIENNLHWQKDYNFKEDNHRLSKGNAPQVMTFLRSCCISLFYALSLTSISTTLRMLQVDNTLHKHFLQATHIF